MRHADWTFREAEARLREHAAWRRVLAIDRVPDYTTLYRCLRRTGEDELARPLSETIRRLARSP